MALWATILGWAPACKDKGPDPDLSFRNKNDLTGAELVEGFEIQATTILGTGIPTSENNDLFVGSVSDPRTGKLTASSYFELRPPTAANTALPAFNLTEAEVKITLPFNLVYKKDAFAASFFLHQTDSRLNPDSVYFSTNARSVALNPIALDTVTVPSIDSLRAKQLVFTFKAPLAQQMLDLLSSNGFNPNIKTFTELAKAFRISVLANTGNQLRLDASQIGAYIKFRKTSKSNPAETSKDSLSLVAGLGPKHFYAVEVDRAGAEILSYSKTGDTLSGPSSNGRSIIQSGAPLWARLKIPGLQPYFARAGQVAIIRAELVLPNDDDSSDRVDYGSVFVWRGVPNQFSLARNAILDSALVNDDIGTSTIDYIYDKMSATRGYKINITRYVQQIASGRAKNNGLTISFPATRLDLRPFSFSTLAAPNRKVKLKIYFVRLKTGI